MSLTPARRLDIARAAVAAAGDAALHWWGQAPETSIKDDGSPVTRADRDAERAILEVLRRADPGASILAEESGLLEGTAGGRWLVDPIDGTRGFLRGGRFWGPLVAYEEEGHVVAGAMALPALQDTFSAARGEGAWRNGERIVLAGASRLEDAIVSVGEIRNLLRAAAWPRLRAILDAASSVRCYGDLASCAQLLSGEADVWVEAGVKVWDVAPMQVLVEEAGGAVVAFGGERRLDPAGQIAVVPGLASLLSG